MNRPSLGSIANGIRALLLLATMGCFTGGLAVAAEPRARVDTALVLAIDGSASIDGVLLDTQIHGHAHAFRDPSLPRVIERGEHGAIAASLVAWAGPGRFQVLVPWARLASAGDLAAFADRVDALPRPTTGANTALGSALRASLDHFGTLPYPAMRRVIDISSNGFSNAGPAPRSARDAAEIAGVTINALVILDEFDWLGGYFLTEVIGGPGAFVFTTKEPGDFARALRAKFQRELSAVGEGLGNRPVNVANGAFRVAETP